MSMPAAVKSYHTAWLTPPGGRPHPVRYAVDGQRLVCFGDNTLANVPDGSRVSVSIHEIAGGQSREAFSASLRRLPPDDVDMNALAELLAHVPLGRTIEEVQGSLDEQRAHRRVVELVAS
jgi:hypothetical protein